MDAAPPNIQLLSRMLSASETRARVIAGNIANQNTPGFTRQVVAFEELVQAALRRGGPNSPELATLEPRILPDRSAPARPDGNNVSLELELNALRENQLLYNTYAAILQGHFNMLNASVSEGR